jgi:probable addiction module antidote protein
MYHAQLWETFIVMLTGSGKSTHETDICRIIALAELFRGLTMIRKMKVSELAEFDASEYLNSDEELAAYLTAVLGENDPALLAAALGDIARARGMSQVAKDSGIAREALYKALRPGSEPRFETISRVCAALGVRLVAQPKQSAH